MPAPQYITVEENDFSLGIDARSAENQIAPGFVRDLLNADIIEKRPRTRQGYQGYGGNVPVRVTGLEYIASQQQVVFSLDSAISLDAVAVDLSGIRSTPIVVYGRSQLPTGPFTSSGDTSKWYSGFSVPTRKVFLATSAAPPFESILVPETEHGIQTTNLFCQVVSSTNSEDRSYSSTLPHTVQVAESNADITVQYQNSTGSDQDVFVFYKNNAPVTGETYVQSISHTGSGAETFTITAGTHALANFNIIGMLQQDLGTDREQVDPDSFLVLPNGNVQFTITNTSAATYFILLEAAPITNQQTGNIPGSTSATVQIALTSPWAFCGIYLEVTPGGNKELVVPDSFQYDDSTGICTIQFTNSTVSAANFVVYWDYGFVRSNKLAVQDTSVSVDGTDTSPQLTIWGLDHSKIYRTDTDVPRAGWVTHIDSYQSVGQRRLISGLGGNLFAARTFEESGTEYKYSQLYPNLQARTAAATVIGPLFWDDSDTPARTRGYVTSPDAGFGVLPVTSVSWDSSNNWTKYTISCPGKQVLDSNGASTVLSAVISVQTGLEDWLTVQDMGYSKQNGTFKIKQILDSGSTIQLWVQNDQIDSSDWDDSGTSGFAGVFTDQIAWINSAPFLNQDSITNAALGTSLLTVLSSLGSVSVVSGVVDLTPIAGGLFTAGTRTSSVVPTRTGQPTSVPASTNLVAGDMLDYTTTDTEWDGRLLRVLSVNPDQDRTVQITVVSKTATVLLGSGDTSFLQAGQPVLFYGAGDFSGSQIITAIPDLTSFEFSTEASDQVVSGILVGNTMELDESYSWQDSQSDSVLFTAETRWVPIEAPTDAYDLTPATHVRYFDMDGYSDQTFVRSTMVQNNMYLTNYQDEQYKYDGLNNYRSGIIPWQPGVLITQDSGTTAKIILDTRSILYTAISADGGYVTILPEDAAVLPFGTTVRLSGDPVSYVVQNTVQDPTDTTKAYLYLDRSLSGSVSATGSIVEVSVYKYYYVLRAVDLNNNIISSCIANSQDYTMELAQDASIHHKLIGLPAWDVLDYDRLELEIYRTKKSTAAPFYKITTIQLDFDNTLGYVNYQDSFSDSDLIDLDPVSTALKGTELGIGWQDAPKAKYVTSIGNSLVLANLEDYPQLDIQIIAPGNSADSDFDQKRFLFRKDSTDTATLTDMVNTAGYEFLDSVTGTISSLTPAANSFSFDTSSPTSAVPGDWIYLTYATVATTGRDLTYSGWWQIDTVASSTVTVNYTGAPAAASYPDSYLIATDPTDVPVLLGTDGNLGMVGSTDFPLFETMRRMSLAINCSMRMVDTSISGMASFRPWIVARGGNDTGKAGRLVVRQPRADTDTPAVLLPATYTNFEIFVNEVRQAATSVVPATSRLYPSRLLASYENYPEIFDSATVVLDSESDSVIDVNPADGQQITAIAPFFGSAAFTSAQQAGVLAVFKTYSIYIVDLNQKRLGNQAVQKLETEGLGCTAPYSISVSKNGIMFANDSGMYCLRRDLTIQYVGRYMERNWTERVNLDRLDLAQGHHYSSGRMYKLSVPLGTDTTNSEVYVYNHTGEENPVPGESKQGAWTRYSNHPATGWANLAPDAYFGTSLGVVYSLRRTGTETDTRDSSSPILFQLQTRGMDFGNGAIRKVIDSVIINYRGTAPETQATLGYSLDFTSEYTDTAGIEVPKLQETTGIGDSPSQDIMPVRHKLDRRRCVYLELQVQSDVLDEPIEIAGISIRVGGLTDRGIRSAAQTK